MCPRSRFREAGCFWVKIQSSYVFAGCSQAIPLLQFNSTKSCQRRIEFAPVQIGGRVGRLPGWIGFDALGDGDALGAGGVEIGPVAGADTCHEGCAVGSTFFSGEDFDGVAVNRGLDLTPEGSARSASAETDAGDRDAEAGEEGEGVLEGVGDAFEDGADEMGRSVGGGDAGEGGADGGVEVGGAFAEEVGSPFQAFAAGGDFGGEGGEGVVIL